MFSAHRLIMLYICTKFHASVSELLGGQEIMTDGQTERRTDNVITIGIPPTFSDGALTKFLAYIYILFNQNLDETSFISAEIETVKIYSSFSAYFGIASMT